MNLSPYQTSVAVNTTVQIAARFASSGSTFIISVLLAKALGVEGFGDFSKIITYVPFFYIITDLGLNASFLRLSNEKSSVSWQDLFVLRIILSLVSVTAAMLILAFLPYGSTNGYTQTVKMGIILYSLSILTHAVITTANALFQKQLLYIKSAAALIAGSGTALLSIFLLPSSLTTALIALLLGSFVSASVSLYLISREIQLSIPFSRKNMLILLKDAAPLTMTLLFNVLYVRIDSVVLALTRSTAEVGMYNLAYKFFDFPLVIPVFFMNSLFPILLKKSRSSVALGAAVRKAGIILGLGGVFCTLLVWFGAPFITLFLNDFSASTDLLRVLSLSFPVFFLSNVTMWTLVTKKRNTALVYIYGAAFFGNLISNVVFVPIFGAYAAAVITIVGEALVLLVSLLAIRAVLRYDQSL